MSMTILEQNDFWTYYLLNLVCTIVILFSSIFFFVTRKESKLNIFIFFGSLILAIVFSALLVVPKILDIKQLGSKEYETQEGILDEIKMIKKGDSYNTIIVVDGEPFELNGSHKIFRDFLGNNIKIHYLENSKYVMKIDLIVNEEKE